MLTDEMLLWETLKSIEEENSSKRKILYNLLKTGKTPLKTDPKRKILLEFLKKLNKKFKPHQFEIKI